MHGGRHRVFRARRGGLGRTLFAVLALWAAAFAPARGDCGPPPASDAQLLATPAAVAAIEQAHARLANAHGRIWRVEGERPSYLVGTFHVAAGGVEEPGARLERLVKGASELFVEVDRAALKAGLERLAADPSRLLRPPGERLSNSLTAEEREAARTVLADYGLSFETADRLRPFVLLAQLGLPPCARAAAADGLDARIEALARAAGVPVRALESVDEQVAALEDAAAIEAALRLMLATAATRRRDWFLQLALYRAGHVGALWRLGVNAMAEVAGEAEAETVAAAFWDRLVARRNRRMARRLAPALAEGGKVVAVGALHLPGADGLVALLRRQGHELTVLGGDGSAAMHR